MTPKPDLLNAHLRYARYYHQQAEQAEWFYTQGFERTRQGLSLFDQERAQIDFAWQWLLSQPPSEQLDTMLLDFADATTEVGNRRYDLRAAHTAA